jgi:hypothetical protein
MNKKLKENEFDAIVVGSGAAGATIARELSRQKKKVLILERGANKPLRESFWGIASIGDEVPVSEDLKVMRAFTTGGSTSLYFAVAEPPPLEAFNSLGVDLSRELAEVRKELPVAPLPDELLGAQAIRLRESARGLGYDWQKNMMLIDQSKCSNGYSYEAKWKARSYVEEAVAAGAALINQAIVQRVLVENNRAVGVEYKLPKKTNGSRLHKAYGAKIILAAGALATPMILRNSGMRNVANDGFYLDPGFVYMGTVPGLKGSDNFVGCMTARLDKDISLGDANLNRAFYRLWMLGTLKFSRLFSYPQSIAIAVKVKDSMGGELREDGRYYKKISDEDSGKLKRGEEAAIKILENAGARRIFRSPPAGNVGGVIRIREHLDARLQTEYANLHVCDGSVIPGNIRLSPALTLICLGKYLARNLFKPVQ